MNHHENGGTEFSVCPRPEYPRPRLRRKNNWLNLNGEWFFETDPGRSAEDRKFYERDSLSGKIVVPFVPESELSGVGITDFMPAVCYMRRVCLPESWLSDGRILLHFGAVDYSAKVWVDSSLAGVHQGGYTPFTLDITEIAGKEFSLSVWAEDDVRSPMQPSGKQAGSYENNGCFYTRSTGIWQTVWLEHVPALYIRDLKLTPDVDNACLHASVNFNLGGQPQFPVTVRVLAGEEVCAEQTFLSTGRNLEFSLPVPSPRLWSLEDPFLYDLEISAGEDAVVSYFGMRKAEFNGHVFELNGKPVFQRLVLDQGYYPDGIYTAPDDEALKNDILLSMRAGFNGARLHMKIFEPRFLYWADRLGYLVWGEYPNWGLDISRPEALCSMLAEWLESVRRDYSSPALVGWCPFNETWNPLQRIYDTVLLATRMVDPYRPVIDSSGWKRGTDAEICDTHNYIQEPGPFREYFEEMKTDPSKAPGSEPYNPHRAGQPYWVSEFGGTWWNIDGGENGWGYGQAPASPEEFYERYEGLVSALLDHPMMFGFCYTQLTDVFQEKNGLYTFDRKCKFDMERICAITSRKAAVEK